MPKEKLNSQYAPPNKRVKTITFNDEEEKNNDDASLNNTSNIGQLYKLTMQDKNKLDESVIYMGTKMFKIDKNVDPLEVFNDYFIKVLNNTSGYILDENISIDSLINDPCKVITHMFLSILYFNNILIPSQVNLHVHTTSFLLGECIYYQKDYQKNILNIHIAKPLILSMLKKQVEYEIKYSNDIITAQYCMRDNLTKSDNNIEFSPEIYKHIQKLFVIADHAASHYIEEYITGKTDWIHHINFTKEIQSYTLITTVFSIKAFIEYVNVAPKLVAVTKKSNTISANINSLLTEQLNINNTNLPGIPSMLHIQSFNVT
ncbi:hypothetical protein MrNuV_ORF075 [Macrobrachium rosenbergii nudivirus]|nr:hypothetical protein MrNuV_ORF075 [Macrobrachium rosenbergii nudivirus]